jgi:DUF4097 and DUF4098 domain-containing protein YvlB
MNFQKPSLAALGATLLLVSGLSVLEGRAQSGDLTRSFKVRPGGLLVVQSDIGAIRVTVGESDRVDVEVRRRARSGAAVEELEVSFNQSGDKVEVIARYPKANRSFFWGNWGRNLDVSFNITVPRSFNAELKTSGGGITVQEMQGRLDARTSGGSLKFHRLGGPVNGSTSGGSIEIDGCDGTADVRTSGGGIRISGVSGDVTARTSGGPISVRGSDGALSLKTSGGGISIEGARGTIQAQTSGGGITAELLSQPQGDCSLTTSGGGISLKIAEHVGVRVHAKTSGGRVRVGFPVTVQGTLETRELRTDLGGGGPALTLRTSGGSIHIDKAS